MATRLYPCRTCRTPLPRTAAHFHKDPMCVDGLKHQCRDCANKAARERYEANADDVCQRLRERRTERAAMFSTMPHYNAA